MNLASKTETSRPKSIFGVELDPIFDLFEKSGFLTQYNGNLRGISGDVHDFDIVSKNDRYRIVFAFVPRSQDGSEGMQIELVKLRAKAYDCTPDLVIVIYPSRPGEKMKELAQYYRFVLVDGSSEIREKLRRVLVDAFP